MFGLYVTWIHQKEFELPDQDWWERTNYAITIAIFILICYLFILEIIQIIRFWLDYITSFWNIIDLINLSMMAATVIVDWANIGHEDFVVISAVAICVMWLKIFYFGWLFMSTAGIIRIVVEIILDMKWFLVLFFMIIAAFTNSFYVIARNDTSHQF